MECRPIKAVQSLEVMIPEPINIDDRRIPIVGSISFCRLPEFRFLAKAKWQFATAYMVEACKPNSMGQSGR